MKKIINIQVVKDEVTILNKPTNKKVKDVNKTRRLLEKKYGGTVYLVTKEKNKA